MPVPSGLTVIFDSGSSTRLAVTRILSVIRGSVLGRRAHVARPAVPSVEPERLVEQVRAVSTLVGGVGAPEVVPQQRAVVRVGALLDDLLRLLLRALAAQIGEPVLGHHG